MWLKLGPSASVAIMIPILILSVVLSVSVTLLLDSKLELSNIGGLSFSSTIVMVIVAKKYYKV